jgi:hypothetical protein
MSTFQHCGAESSHSAIHPAPPFQTVGLGRAADEQPVRFLTGKLPVAWEISLPGSER